MVELVVGIVKSTEEEISQKIIELLKLVDYKPSKDKILLKPNIMDSAKPKSGVNVHPLIVETLYNHYRDQGYEVIIGEGPISVTGKGLKSVVRGAGYKAMYKEFGITNFNDKEIERVEKEWKYGKLSLPKVVETHEYIDIAAMKTHWITTVTLGLKNQKGLLLPKDKKQFHKRGLHEPIIELNKICTPDLTIIDGIFALEGTGPTQLGGGKPFKMDLLLAGKNIIEVDNVACNIMGFDVDKIEHIPKTDFKTIGEPIENVRKQFKPPNGYLDVPMGKSMIRLLVDSSSCTPMGDIMIQAFGNITTNQELMQKLDKYPKIAISTGGAEFVGDFDLKICVGQCSKKVAEKYNLIHVPGCPIKPEEFVDILLEKL